MFSLWGPLHTVRLQPNLSFSRVKQQGMIERFPRLKQVHANISKLILLFSKQKSRIEIFQSLLQVKNLDFDGIGYTINIVRQCHKSSQNSDRQDHLIVDPGRSSLA